MIFKEVVSSDVIVVNADPQELGIILGCLFGVILGLAIIVAIAAITRFLIKARIKGIVA